MQPTTQLELHLLALVPHARGHRLSAHDEPSLPRLSAVVRESEEVEGLGLAHATLPTSLGRKASKLDQTGLIRMQL